MQEVTITDALTASCHPAQEGADSRCIDHFLTVQRREVSITDALIALRRHRQPTDNLITLNGNHNTDPPKAEEALCQRALLPFSDKSRSSIKFIKERSLTYLCSRYANQG